MFKEESANADFAKGLKNLRLKFNLLQKQISTIAGITQSVYSSYETGRKPMSLNDADNISKNVWGVGYCDFVKFSKSRILINNLPVSTLNAIEDSKKIKLKDQQGVLAKELDRLINAGYLNQPITSKQLLVHMRADLHARSTTEITNLLTKAPRNRYVTSVGTEKGSTLFQLKEFAVKS